MQTLPTDYSHAQLVDALLGEFNQFIEDGYEDELDLTMDEYKTHLESLSHSQLLTEMCLDDEYLTLSDFMHAYS